MTKRHTHLIGGGDNTAIAENIQYTLKPNIKQHKRQKIILC